MFLLLCHSIFIPTKEHGIPCIMRTNPKYSSKSRADDYPHLQFIVIINPNDGPGNSTSLDLNFQRELPKLLSRTNIATVGYVRTIYATRNKTTVFEDVDKYAGWMMANTTSNYILHGIFFDETPSNYTIESAEYMDEVDKYVKNHYGFAGNYVQDLLSLLILDHS